ncbi:MAG: hypothetical protein NXI25_00865 [bacterium]|nr:hypothetical protein [bacterium]
MLALLGSGSLLAQDYQERVQTLDQTVATLYEVISGDAGVERDWELFRYLFIPEAQLIPSGKDKSGKSGYQVMTPEGYVNTSGKWLEENGFHEKEIHRVTETYGTITHVFSTYESYRSRADKEPFARGINSIQLLYDEERWWIVSVYWMGETEEQPIPARYLPD